MRELIDFLNKCTVEYDCGTPLISDKRWDELYFKLKKMEEETGIIYPDSPTQKIHYETIPGFTKRKHNHLMLSLNKTKDWNEFVKYFDGKSAIAMCKMDGMTCSLCYENGELVSAETRGDGEVGEDILHHARVISNIPKSIPQKERLIVDGEIIITYQDFDKFKGEFDNPRNFVSGTIRLLDSKQSAQRNLKFIVWNVIEGIETNSFKERLNKVQNLGFTVVPWTMGFENDAAEWLKEKAEELGYPIDGLVGRFDDIQYGLILGKTLHHFRGAFAFKFYDKTYETKLKDIIWQVGGSGQVTPVAIFEPVETGDATLERANLHNYEILQHVLGKPYKGQNITVYRANEIIPQILHSERPTTNQEVDYIKIDRKCPICGEWLNVDNDQHWYCENTACQGKLLNRLERCYSDKGLNIKGISEKTIQTLIEDGFIRKMSDIYDLDKYQEQLTAIDGFAEKKIQNFLQGIEGSKRPSLTNFIYAIGIPKIGYSKAADLAEEFKTYEAFRDAVDKSYHFEKLYGFGERHAEYILTFDYSEADELFGLLEVQEKKEDKNAPLTGQRIAITGRLNNFKNRKQFENLVKVNGGKFAESVTKDTTILISNEDSCSHKIEAAKKFGIKILNEKDFFDIFKIL